MQDLIEVISCCHRDSESNLEQLRSLVPSKVRPTAVLPIATIYSFTRTNVPILCHSAAFGSLEATRYLVTSGAKHDQADSFGVFLFF